MLPPSRSLAVAGVEAVGAYALLRLGRDGVDPGSPGQFFMLQFELEPGPALLVGGGIGAAILPWLARVLPDVRTLLGFRTRAHAVCAALIDPDATVVIEPTLVTEPLARILPGFGGTVYACGPDAMLRAVAALAAEHGVRCQLAMEAAMACGFGACYGCAARVDGSWKRLCVEGPVLEAGRVLA